LCGQFLEFEENCRDQLGTPPCFISYGSKPRCRELGEQRAPPFHLPSPLTSTRASPLPPLARVPLATPSFRMRATCPPPHAAANAFEERGDVFLHRLSPGKAECLLLCIVCWTENW
jgi:hypothetical protein